MFSNILVDSETAKILRKTIWILGVGIELKYSHYDTSLKELSFPGPNMQV